MISGQALPAELVHSGIKGFPDAFFGSQILHAQHLASMTTCPLTMTGWISSQSVQTTPSKLYFLRSRPVMTSLFEAKPDFLQR